MKKLALTLLILFLGLVSFALSEDQEALEFIKGYISAANSYSNTLPSYYSPNAKIIRVVEKKDGGTAKVITDMKEYTKQLKLGAVGAKVSKYKNNYSNLQVSKVSNGYKISGFRQPTGETYKLPVYFIVNKNSGQWKIVEESMNTRVQTLLKYAK